MNLNIIKKIKLKTILSFILLNIIFVGLQAQSPEELAKKRAAEMQAFQKQQEKGMQKLKAEFQIYQDEQDKAFAEYLEKRWEEYHVFNGAEIPDSPKPDVPPKVDPDNANSGEVPLKKDPIDVSSPKKPLLSDPANDKLPEPIVAPSSDPNFVTIYYNFYGADISIKTNKNLLKPFTSELKEVNFANYWNVITLSDYQNTVNQLVKYARQMRLNGWSYYLLVDAYSDKIHANDRVSSHLLSWVLLLKSGYKVKIGYSGSQVYLMLPSIQQIYSYKYISMQGLKYYLPDKFTSNIFTYEKDFGGASKTFNMDFQEALNLPLQKKYRKLNFEYAGKKYWITIIYNQNLVDFYNTYPSLDIDHYFNSPVSKITAASIKEQFSKVLESQSDENEANILLAFMHQAFPYKTDSEQFGREKYFYVEDIFHYPYSDCEDRSVLYAYLINKLVGRKAIGLNGPGHVFTAVEFNSLFGNYVEYENRDFTICDPTYIGAKVGMMMPEMGKVKLVAIPIK